MRYILYCAIKKQRLVLDTIYSILTIIRTKGMNQNVKFVIITDQVDLFDKEFSKINFIYTSNIILERIDKDTVNDWIGNENYIFRVKIKVIEFFFKKYKQNVLFFDSDIIAIKNITPLFEIIENEKTIMYYNYKNIVSHLFNLFNAFEVDKNKLIKLQIINDIILFEGFEYSIPCNYSYYASPVLGINYLYNKLITKVLDFTDKMYKATSFGTTEEIAFAFIFQKYCSSNLEEAYTFVRTHKIISESSTLFFPYLFGIETKIDKLVLEKYLLSLNMSYSMLERMNLSYENFLMFLTVLKAYIRKESLDYFDLTINAIIDGFISNSILSKQEFGNFLKKFKKVVT